MHAVALMFSESMGAIARPAGGRAEPARRQRQPRGGLRGARPRPTATRSSCRPRASSPSTRTCTRTCRSTRCKDFAPVGLIANTSNMFVVNPRSGIKTLQGPRRQGAREPGHRLVRLVRQRQHPAHRRRVARSSRPTSSSCTCRTRASAPALHRRDRRRPDRHVQRRLRRFPTSRTASSSRIAVSPKRIDELPGVPTVVRSRRGRRACPSYAPPAIWYGIVAPKGTPQDVVAKVNAAMAQTLKQAGRARKARSPPAPRPPTTRAANRSRGVIQSDYATLWRDAEDAEHHRRLTVTR